MKASRGAIALLLILPIAACARNAPGEGPGFAGPTASRPAASSPAAARVLPGGWRWESYGGVELGVPADFGYDFGPARLSQWCTVKGRIGEPVVGRPGMVTAVGCSIDNQNPPPDTLLVNTGTVVAFGQANKPDGTSHLGDQTTIRIDKVEIKINAPQPLTAQILATLHAVTTDDYGCSATHPISKKPSWRPDHPVALTTLRGVTAVSICKYRVTQFTTDQDLRLYTSQRLDGPTAASAIAGLARTPVGGGPDDASLCTRDVSYGDDVTVLQVTSGAGPSTIVLHYSGCDHNGIDDGVTVRTLTKAAVAPFITGPNQALMSTAGDAMAKILGMM